MRKIVGLWVLYLGTVLSTYAQVDTSYIYNTNMPYGTLDLRIAKSPTRYYYLQEGTTFSFRESAPGVKTNTYVRDVTWNTSDYGEGNLREVNGDMDNFVMNYRLLKPENYNANYSPGYPIIIMIHGAGESGNCWIDERCKWATASWNPTTNSPPAPTADNHRLLNNDRSLLHGGAQHLTAVKSAGGMLPNDPNLPSRAFPGFVLFPQSLNGWLSPRTVEDAIRILRLVIKKYNIDESRVYIHGLSNGGIGTYQAIKRAPWLFAAALPMSAPTDAGISNHGIVPEVSKIPLWIFQGGQDIAPPPNRTYNYVRNFRNAGGNVRYYLYPHLGHGTWNTAYKEPDFFSWILEKRKYNPHIYYVHPYICNTTQTGVRMGYSNGFYAYQWQRDGEIIPGATGPEITADTPGTYRGRFSRVPNPSEGDWERWSDPVVVSELEPEKPLVDVLGTAHLRGPGLANVDENNTVALKSVASAELYEWYKDGSLINFPNTDIDDTLRVATFTNGSASGNGAYTLVTRNYNCPSPPSDPVNLFFNDSSPQNIVLNSGSMDLKGTVAASSIFLSWNDGTGLETGYEIWRRTPGTDFTFVTKTPEDAVSYHDQNLNPGTTYEYKVRAVNNAARSNYVPSDDLSVNYTFTTLGDVRFPPPPQNLQVVANTLNSITLSWTASKDESSVKTYYVYFRNDSVSTEGNTTTFTLTGLTPNSEYPISVKALDYGDHLSQPSNQVIATTYMTGLNYKHSTGAWASLDDSSMVATWANPEYTGKVANFTLDPRTQDDFFNFQFTGYLNIETEGTYYFDITSDDGSRLYLNGNLIADNDGRHGRKTVASEGIYLTAGAHPIVVEYFEDVGGHHLSVRYRGPGIGDGTSFVLIPDSALRSGNYVPGTPPAAPTGLVANATGMERIALSWQFADDAQTDYEVYRATGSSGNYEIVARAKGTSAIDTIGLVPGTEYSYKVKTVNNQGSSAFSGAVSVTTASDSEAPSAPQGLQVSSKTLSNAALSWEASTDNVGVVKYEIFSGGNLIGTSTIHALTVEGLEPNTQYLFTVKAVDASGNRSASSAELAVVTNTSAIFYSLATGNLNELSSWRRNADGTGEQPLNFTDNGQYFMISNRTNTSLGGAWTIGGSSSRVIVPTGVTLTADQAFTANVELQGDATINLNHAVAPVLVKLSPTSTVNFNAYPTIPSLTYGNVILSGTVAKTFQGDTLSILGDLTLQAGLILKGAAQNRTMVRLAGNLDLQGARPATAADNAIDLVLSGGASQSIQSGSDLHLFRLTTAPGQTITVTNPAGTPIRILLGSLNGGGLRLANGSLLSIADHELILDDAAVINPAQQTGALSTTGGDLTINSNSAQNSYLYFDAVQNRVDRLSLNLSGSGNLTVRAPMAIAEGIKISNGTLVAEKIITLLASAERSALIYEIENTGKITGEVTVQKYLAPAGRIYRYLSSPVTPVTVAEWQQSFPITGNFNGSSTGEGLDNSPSLFAYRENNGGWIAHPPGAGSNAAAIQKGVGYAALLRNTTNPVTLASTGNPFQGTVIFSLAGTQPGPGGKGWQLVGNPYASPVMWNDNEEAWTRSGVGNVIAIRKDTIVSGQHRSQFSYYDTRLGGGVISAGEAFWVRTFSDTPALAVSEKAKVDPEANPPVAPDTRYLSLTMTQGTSSDAAYIVFSGEGTDDFDGLSDGRKIKNEGIFNLATITADTVLLAVNTVTNEFCSKDVAVHIADVTPGAYTLAFDNLESLPDVGSIILTDRFTGGTHAVNGTDYAFSVTDDASSMGARFVLSFTKQQVDITTPVVEALDICAPGPGFLAIAQSQVDVAYQITDASGNILSEPVIGTGERIELELFPDKLVAGPNTVQVTVGFEGCDRQNLPGSYTVNYIADLSVETESDISICEGADVILEASGAPSGGFYRWFDSEGNVIDGATNSTLTVSDVFTEAVYYVAVAHPNGCESELATIHIYADTLDTPVVQMKEDTLYTEVVGFYQWRKDGADIPGATYHYFVPVDEGEYTVVASNGGCNKESAPYTFAPGGEDPDGEDPDGEDPDGEDPDGEDPDGEDPVTGIDNGNNPEFELNIYPVPSNGSEINLLLRSPKMAPVLIELVDAMGRVHFRGTVEARVLMQGTRITPYAPLYNGIYFLRATQEEIKARKKIIVKN